LGEEVIPFRPVRGKDWPRTNYIWGSCQLQESTVAQQVKWSELACCRRREVFMLSGEASRGILILRMARSLQMVLMGGRCTAEGVVGCEVIPDHS
jgi:hypothetical protein